MSLNAVATPYVWILRAMQHLDKNRRNKKTRARGQRSETLRILSGERGNRPSLRITGENNESGPKSFTFSTHSVL